MKLYNKIDKRILKEELLHGETTRFTLSFYRYIHIDDPLSLRDEWYCWMSDLNILGRIYIANEGVNAQISVPESNWEKFLNNLNQYPGFKGVRLNHAIEQDPVSFFVLKIKIREKIVADGLPKDTYDLNIRGKALNAEQFNKITDRPETIVVDMRNHYESEVGHFRGAVCPDVETFRESLIYLSSILEGKKEVPLVLYCTGGIRCEKASSYLKSQGFNRVYQLEGGIIEYVRQVRNKQLENKFLGSNFVFDERLGERISNDIIANCHQCGTPCDQHVNCANNHCHILFIQCPACSEEFDSCCSKKCKDFNHLSDEQKVGLKSEIQFNGTRFGKGRYRAFQKSVRPKIN